MRKNDPKKKAETESETTVSAFLMEKNDVDTLGKERNGQKRTVSDGIGHVEKVSYENAPLGKESHMLSP